MEKTQPSLILKIAEIISTWFYVGKIRFAPGTWGTLATVPLVIFFHSFGSILYMACAFIFLFVGIFLSDIYEKSKGDHDLSEIVVDEVAGYLIAMTMMPMTWQALTGGFILFRFFDILKPFPISWLDRKIKGGLGVMVDDVAAGVATNIILQFLYANTAWLGSQLFYINT
jgi:phosphatidylglycerophosphatase A